MCSAGEGRLVWVSVARVVEEGHRGLGEVVAGGGPFVVLVAEHGSDESDGGAVVGEDPDDVGPSFHFLVESFERVVGPDLAPVGPRERVERQHVGLGVSHQRGGLGEPVGEGGLDLVPAGLDL